MQQNDIELLLKKYQAGDCTPEEIAFLESWYAQWNQTIPVSLSAEQLAEDLQLISSNIQPLYETAKQRNLWPRIAAAASILLAVSAGGYFLLHKEQPKQQVAEVHDVLPGGNKAYLTLGNGQRISLTDAKNGTIASQAGKTIQKTAEGMIVYDDSHNTHSSTGSIFNTIETPRGGQYQVVLPDGSKVWLNAASSLKYPAAFTGNDRQVELTGEAYFEVAKDKAHPFKVKTPQQTVEVLGTHFDINSYADEPNVKTTLLEGSVKIVTTHQQQLIRPGEQAVLANNKFKIQEADEEEVMAWKNGLFIFNDEPLESIMRKVARWYDVDIQYGDIDKTQAFGGGVSRFSNISKVLQKLESTRLVRFKIQGKTIYVTK